MLGREEPAADNMSLVKPGEYTSSAFSLHYITRLFSWLSAQVVRRHKNYLYCKCTKNCPESAPEVLKCRLYRLMSFLGDMFNQDCYLKLVVSYSEDLSIIYMLLHSTLIFTVARVTYSPLAVAYICLTLLSLLHSRQGGPTIHILIFYFLFLFYFIFLCLPRWFMLQFRLQTLQRNFK